MERLLINFSSAKSGGGRVILDNFLKHLVVPENTDIHVILPLNYELKNEKLTIVNVPNWMFARLGMCWFYFVFFPSYCKCHKIKKVLNFGDVIIPRVKEQVYFFDWAYLLLNDENIWNKMSFKSRCIRKFKSNIIKLFKGNNGTVIVQSEEIALQYRNKLGFNKDIFIIPTPVSKPVKEGSTHNISGNDIVYISNFAPHKNFEIIPKVAFELKKWHAECRIILTLDPDSKEWVKLKSEIEYLGVVDMVVNIGPLSNEDVFSVLAKSKALFFPSLLESYGIPLIEAMYAGTPVLVSDTPFIRSVCKESVYYFNPDDEINIARCIQDFLSHESPQKSAVEVLDKIPDWNDYTKKIINRCFG